MPNELTPCYMCDNAKINNQLTNDNDFSCYAVGTTLEGFRIMIVSGNGKPVRIEFEQWDEDSKKMDVVGVFLPNYCPICGRELTEYCLTEDGEYNG